jgi:hypothetical protein
MAVVYAVRDGKGVKGMKTLETMKPEMALLRESLPSAP